MLPFSESTEAALIARLVVDPSSIQSLNLSADDFHVGAYRKAFRAMLSLANAHRPIDLVTLKDAGVDIGDVLDSVGPAHRAPVESYAAIVRRDAFRRRYIAGLTELVEKADKGEPQAMVAALQEQTAALADEIGPSDSLGRVDLGQHTLEPPDPLLGVLSPTGTTVLYADGGSGKGWIAAKLVADLLTMGIRSAVLDFEMHPGEWSHRFSRFGVGRADVSYFAPPTTMDRWATESAAQELQREGVGFLIVDSALYASDLTDPYSPETALAYARARRRLNNLPTLLLAHVPASADKIFGSIVWRAEARLVWRLGIDEGRHRFLENKKANEYPHLEGKRLEITFDAATGTLEMHE